MVGHSPSNTETGNCELFPLGEGFFYWDIYGGSYLINGTNIGVWLPMNRLYFHKDFERPLFVTGTDKKLSVKAIKDKLWDIVSYRFKDY